MPDAIIYLYARLIEALLFIEPPGLRCATAKGVQHDPMFCHVHLVCQQAAQVRHPLDSVPANYELTTEGELPKATVTARPLATDLPFPLNLQLVTDFYSKTK